MNFSSNLMQVRKEEAEGWCSHTLIRVVWLCLSVTFYLNQDYPTSWLFWATVDEVFIALSHNLMQWCPAQSLRGYILLCVTLVLAISRLCDKHQDQKQLVCCGGLCLPYNSTSQSSYEGSQSRDSDRNLEAGTEAKTTEKSCFLACSL